jgi:hypothetical protein
MQKIVHGNWLKMNDLLPSFLSFLCDFYFFHMFNVKRLHRLTDYKESSPEGLSILNFIILKITISVEGQ